MVHKDHPHTWIAYRGSLCQGCQADCCAMLLEVKLGDLIRLGLATEDDRENPRRLAKRLHKEGVVKSYRESTGLFMMQSQSNDDCQFLDSKTRLCTVYEKRPDVCRSFPRTGLRPNFCPAKPAIV
jgi:uncharacterized protein